MPKKRELVRNTEIEAVVDATECEIESLKKNSGNITQERRNTIKTQIMTDEKDLRILNVSFLHGSVHDFRLFCGSRIHFFRKCAFDCGQEIYRH